MEIERKYLVQSLPDNRNAFPSRLIEQAYLSTAPVVRVRRDGEDFYLTYKSKGLMVREEYNLPLTEESYCHLLGKADGNVISKTRYCIPLSPSGREDAASGSSAACAPDSSSPDSSACSQPLTAELDVFHGLFEGLFLVEVEFPDEETANHFTPPEWFGKEVTFSGEYQNSRLSHMSRPEISLLMEQLP